MGMTPAIAITEPDRPRCWFGCLNCCNAGRLVGHWFRVGDDRRHGECAGESCGVVDRVPGVVPVADGRGERRDHWWSDGTDVDQLSACDCAGVQAMPNISTSLKNGATVDVPSTQKPLQGPSAGARLEGVRVEISGCVGARPAVRAYVRVAMTTKANDNTFNLYGKPHLL